MNGERPPFVQDRIARAARRDALRDAPVFCDTLHARVMDALRVAVFRPRVVGSARIWMLPVSIAAAVLVATAVAFNPGEPTRRPPRAALPTATTGSPGASGQFALSAPPVSAALASWGRRESAMEADLGPAHWAGLDHDARLAARYILEPLSLPSPSPKPSVR